jgi:hypothetical protein
MADVRMEHLKDENHVQKLQCGSSRLYSLTSPAPAATRTDRQADVTAGIRRRRLSSAASGGGHRRRDDRGGRTQGGHDGGVR